MGSPGGGVGGFACYKSRMDSKGFGGFGGGGGGCVAGGGGGGYTGKTIQYRCNEINRISQLYYNRMFYENNYNKSIN